MNQDLYNHLTKIFIVLAVVEYFHLIAMNERGKRPKWLHFLYMISWFAMLFFGILLIVKG